MLSMTVRLSGDRRLLFLVRCSLSILVSFQLRGSRKIDLDCGTVEYRDLVDPGGVIYTQVLVGCNSLGTYKYPPFLPNYT